MRLEIREIAQVERDIGNPFNLAAPVLINGTVYVVDQQNADIYRRNGTGFDKVFDGTANIPDGLAITSRQKIVSIAPGPGGDDLDIAFTVSAPRTGALPDAIGRHALPDPTRSLSNAAIRAHRRNRSTSIEPALRQTGTVKPICRSSIATIWTRTACLT